MKDMLETINAKHKELLSLQPKFSKELEKSLYDWFRIALTYTSNALEGSTLSHIETAQILEKNMTVQGKSLTEHLEAVNHAQAIDRAKDLAELKKRQDIQVADILMLHACILQKINDSYAGKFRNVSVRIMGSTLPIPNYLKVPVLMDDLATWLHNTQDPVVKIAADAHLKLVYIHPFVDGNGRTARLLMNLLLLQEQYPLVLIQAEERLNYIKAVQKAVEFIAHNFTAEQFVLDSHALDIKELQDYYALIFQSIEYSLDEYIKAAHESGFNA